MTNQLHYSDSDTDLLPSRLKHFDIHIYKIYLAKVTVFRPCSVDKLQSGNEVTNLLLHFYEYPFLLTKGKRSLSCERM